jgi:hypothetical protein
MSALAGVALIVVAEFLPVSSTQSVFADIGFLFLLIAAALSLASRRPDATSSTEPTPTFRARTWNLTIIGLGLGGALVTQTWYRPGTIIAGGDIAPPIGGAWIGKIFTTFGWSGFDLGAPSNNQTELPKAVTFWLLHALGASDALAQRVWLSLLIAGIFVGSAVLARSLGLSPLAGAVVAVFYFFNPMTLSQVGIYDNYLTAMVLVPALAAALISFGRGRLRLWQLCLVFAVAAPFLGYVESNPPLVGMVAATTVLTPLFVWVRFGRDAARSAVWGVMIAGAVLVGVSSYWIIPSLATLHSVSSSTFTPLSTWAFTESRATLTNAFWLNTAWGWSYSFYFPYAADFARFPLELILGLLPIAAFIGLSFRRVQTSLGRATEGLRGLLAIGVLGVIFLSTGTRPPGNVVFDPLYRLPYGWLLQEPGRFLIVAAVGYAVLCGLLVDQLARRPKRRISPKTFLGKHTSAISSSLLAAGAIAVLALVSGFPLWSGSVVTGARQGFPSTHVKVPRDWISTADYLNSSSSPRGTLLVLPPDDFYAMPYTWYYGNDSFIANLFSRDVIVPSAQSYAKVSAELLSSVQLEATELQSHDWNEAGRVLTALGTPIVLVRGDIVDNFGGRSIESPASLLTDMKRDPEMTRIYRDHKLSLFELKERYRVPPTNFATVNTSTPNLENLSLVPQRTVIVTATPQAGHIALFQPSASKTWRLNKSTVSARLVVPKGWRYSIKSSDSKSLRGLQVTRSQAPRSHDIELRVQLPSNPYLGLDGSFAPSAWGPVGNCYDVKPVKAPQYLRSREVSGVAPGGASALELSASIDAACASKAIAWQGGPIQLNLQERTVEGSPARVCVWETPIDRCAPIANLTTSDTWSDYRTIVRPAPGTKNLTLFLYAYPVSTGKPSVERYADVSVKSLTSSPAIVVVGVPAHSDVTTRLVEFKTGYSKQWNASPGATHVVVDGMRNGWIVTSNDNRSLEVTDAATQYEFIDGVVLAVAMALLAFGLWWVRRKSGSAKRKKTRGGTP